MNRRRFLGVLSSAVAGVKSGAAEKLISPAASAVPPTCVYSESIEAFSRRYWAAVGRAIEEAGRTADMSWATK